MSLQEAHADGHIMSEHTVLLFRQEVDVPSCPAVRELQSIHGPTEGLAVIVVAVVAYE